MSAPLITIEMLGHESTRRLLLRARKEEILKIRAYLAAQDADPKSSNR
jgi:hypothetical protein